MIGVEAGGHGIETGEHAARFADGTVGILQGTKSYVLQDDDGQIRLTHSISAGLDYATVGPEHSLLHDLKRAEYTSVYDTFTISYFLDLLNAYNQKNVEDFQYDYRYQGRNDFNGLPLFPVLGVKGEF